MPRISHEEKKRADTEARKKGRAAEASRARIEQLEVRIAETGAGHPRHRSGNGGPGFYDDRAAAQPVIDRHHALMWTVGDLMHQWEELQSARDLHTTTDA